MRAALSLMSNPTVRLPKLTKLELNIHGLLIPFVLLQDGLSVVIEHRHACDEKNDPDRPKLRYTILHFGFELLIILHEKSFLDSTSIQFVSPAA